jgi:hypothetical protein
MVQRKQARRKPEDLVVLADADSPACQGPPPRGGVRTALAPLPNYMRATTCSGARGGRASRKDATCSSTMKGPAAAHACSYAYCSLKGRASAAPLDAFLASRRRLVRTQRSMKLQGASPFRDPANGGDGYFVEIRAEGSGGGSCGSSVVVSGGSLRSSTPSSDSRGRRDDGTRVLLDRDDSGAACESDISDDSDAQRQGNIPRGEISDNARFVDAYYPTHIHIVETSQRDKQCVGFADCGGDAPKEYSSDGISSALSVISFEDASSDAVSSQRTVHVSGRRRSQAGTDQTRPFKPKAPNFLPVETGPEAEKVDLKHQPASDPRDAEEWMVDYALRKAVRRLARAQKRKVEVLVQAFETVLPTAASEKEPAQRDDGKNGLTVSRPFQACS